MVLPPESEIYRCAHTLHSSVKYWNRCQIGGHAYTHTHPRVCMYMISTQRKEERYDVVRTVSRK